MEAVKEPVTTGIRTEEHKTPITFDRLYVNEFQKPKTKTVQVRQVITRKSFYPSAKAGSNLQPALFGNEEFGFSEQEFESVETRMAWLLVPENMPEAEVIARIEAANKKGATIYKILSNQPILDENQEYAVKQGIRTKDQFANKQVARYPVDDAEGRGGKLILDKAGNVQYRRTFLWNSPVADQDDRGKGVYLTPEIAAELNGASIMKGQNI